MIVPGQGQTLPANLYLLACWEYRILGKWKLKVGYMQMEV